jgi:small subunit ribosomal protein S16
VLPDIVRLPPCVAARQPFKIMVRIRLKRIGAKNNAVYRIVVADSRSPRDGRFIEEIGTYSPLQKQDNVKLDLDRARHWLSRGAQPTETVASFMKKAAARPAPASA